MVGWDSIKENITMDNIKISIIVPVYNDEAIHECIASLEQLEYPKDKYEIIIVDNNSAPWVREAIKQTSARYVHEPLKGSYMARNTGIKHARGKYLVFTDSDCIVSSNWLNEIDNILNDDNILGVMGYASGNNKNKIAQHEQKMYEEVIGAFTTDKKLKRIDTRNFAMKKQLSDVIGTFNSELKFGGDMEYGARAHEAGFKIVFSKNVEVKHTNPTDLPKLLSKRVKQNYGNMLILEKHNEKFVRTYFPHLLRFKPTLITRLVWMFLWLESKLEFPIAGSICKILPNKISFIYFKIINIIAIRYGQLSYVLNKKLD